MGPMWPEINERTTVLCRASDHKPQGRSRKGAAMIGVLHPDEVESVLYRGEVGRVACLAGGRPYVVPITYAYAGGDVYGHALPGRLIGALRSQPRACFEVDERESAETWCSVVAEAVYEELREDAERKTALGLLSRAEPAALPETVPGVVFRLRLTDKAGRYAQSSA
jgi:nitroimidazol reductase NimA-like FMN-containing flavoprotein (pyridoxamine 5'-phosphate oxidase superfamily)